MKNQKTVKQKASSILSKRESPQDFMLAFVDFKKKNPEHSTLTAKGFALLRGYLNRKK